MILVKYALTGLISLIVFGPLLQLGIESIDVDPQVWSHVLTFQLPSSAIETAKFSLVSLATALLIGIYSGCLTFFNSKSKTILDYSMGALVAIPTYVFGFAYLSFLDFSGPIQTLIKQLSASDFFFEPRTTLIAGVLFGISTSPYVYFAVRSALKYNITPLYESAEMLGYSKISSFAKVILPTLAPWILTGGLVVILESLADFGFVDLFGVDTISRNLFKSWSSFFSFGAASRLGLIILSICLIISAILSRIEKKIEFAGLEISPQTAASRSNRFIGAESLMSSVLFSIVAVLIPAGVLVYNSVQIQNFSFSPFLLAAGQTLIVSFFTATIATLLISIFFISVRKTITNRTLKILSVGYGLPGTLLAVCFYIFFIGNLNTNLIQNFFLTPIILLSFIFLSKFGGILFKSLESARALLKSDLIEAASTLASPQVVWRKVEWSQYKPAVSMGFVMIFLEAAKELPATLLIKPTSSPTLALRVHQYASEADWATGSIYSLTLLVLITFIILLKFIVTKFLERQYL